MKLNIKVIPKSKQNNIEEVGKDNFKIHLTTVPEKGKANEAVIKMLSKHLHIAKSKIKIIKGLTQRDKIIEIC